ncbi:MAG: histidine phosphatase family protein [Clostridia bacterium]|nr:histidine phosphatase family protein [Clostridia bacterium]
MEKNCYSFYADPFNFKGFTNGENIKDLCDRTQAFLKELISKDDGKVYLISTHGCAMRALINYLKEDPSDYWCGRAPYNCSFTIVETKNGTPTITDVDKVFYDKNLIVDYFKKP